MRLMVVLTWIHLLTTCLSAQTQRRYFYVPFAEFAPRAINNLGEVVGTVHVGGLARPAYYGGDKIVQLSSWIAEPLSINDKGEVIGSVAIDVAGNWVTYPFYWWQGKSKILGSTNAEGRALWINNKSEIVGYVVSTNSLWSAAIFKGDTVVTLDSLISTFQNSEGTDRILYRINDRSQMLGHFGVTPFLYYNERIQVGDTEWHFDAINNSGSIAGCIFDSSLTVKPAIWDDLILRHFPAMDNGQGCVVSINNQDEAVGNIQGTDGFITAFLYSKGTLQYLKDLVVNIDAGLRLQECFAINDRGQIIGNATDINGLNLHWFLLNPVPDCQQALNAPVVQPTYASPPSRQLDQTNLVFITHGAIPIFEDPEESTAWVDTLADRIKTHLDSRAITGWKVYRHKWIAGATFDLNLYGNGHFGPESSLDHARREGEHLGQCISTQGWSHIHLIAHSAGAGLIQAITDKTSQNTNVSIHCTFLDPFLGYDRIGAEQYGRGATWADHYFVKDLLTDFIWARFTSGPLDNCFNVNVTELDTNKLRLPGFISADIPAPAPCTITSARHSWPTQFYINSVDTETVPDYEGLGFNLTKEAGHWDAALTHQTNNTPYTLGPSNPQCVPLFLAPLKRSGPSLSFLDNFVIQSRLESFTKSSTGFHAVSSSPVWLSMYFGTTSTVNTVTFDAQFLDAAWGGLLTVYWNTNTIGSVDAAISRTEKRRYAFSFPKSEERVTHVLSFRLDSSASSESAIAVNNVSVGFAGVWSSFALSQVTNSTNSTNIWELNGQPSEYLLTVSTNLHDWHPMATLINTTGCVRFYDSASPNAPARLYRALLP